MKSRLKAGIQLENLNRYDLDFQFSGSHFPVMFNEVVHFFKLLISQNDSAQILVLDCTFGRGGHSQGFLKNNKINVKLFAFDQDIEAIKHGQHEFANFIKEDKLTLIHDNFSNLEKYNLPKFDYILLDLGVSSPQLDQAERGFSFYHDGPLDMRMNQNLSLNAEFIVNTYSEEELNKLFQDYGEIYKPYRVTRAICHDRKEIAFQTTKQLAGLIERVDGWRKKGQHPATQYFMALRLAVNQELEVLKYSLPILIDLLNDNGLLSIISFHSLEDRIVKNCFKESNFGSSLYKKVISPTDEECRLNTRSRSAKLRVFKKNGVQDGLNKYDKYQDDNESE